MNREARRGVELRKAWRICLGHFSRIIEALSKEVLQSAFKPLWTGVTERHINRSPGILGTKDASHGNSKTASMKFMDICCVEVGNKMKEGCCMVFEVPRRMESHVT